MLEAFNDTSCVKSVLYYSVFPEKDEGDIMQTEDSPFNAEPSSTNSVAIPLSTSGHQNLQVSSQNLLRLQS